MKISVVITTLNAEKHLQETLKSIINQTHMNFECIVCDEGSTDNTLSILNDIHDSRFVVLHANPIDETPPLEMAFKAASGKYIARLNSGDLMHQDRLKIQAAILEEEPSIAVCGTHTFIFNQTTKPILSKCMSGIIENPLIHFLGEPVVYHGSLFFRKDLLDKIMEPGNTDLISGDLMWMSKIAQLGGQFYIESQPLNYQRIPDPETLDQTLISKLVMADSLAKKRIINHFISSSSSKEGKEAYQSVLNSLLTLLHSDLIQEPSIYHTFRMLFAQNKTLAQGSSLI